MRSRICPLILIGTLLVNMATAQAPSGNRLELKNKSFVPDPISQKQLNEFVEKTVPVAGLSFAIIQVESIPNAMERNQLREQGIELLDYIPSRAYIARLSRQVNLATLKRLRIRSILPITPSLKIDKLLLREGNEGREQEVEIAFFKGVPFDTVAYNLARHGYTIIDAEMKQYQLLRIKVPAGRLQQLSLFPFILYVDVPLPAPQPLLFDSRNASKANVLQSGLPGGYHLTGKGVTIGIAEAATGAPDIHTDFFDRSTTNFGITPGNYHATHVFGIAAGAGNLNEKYKGYAPEVSFVGSGSSFFSAQMGTLFTNSHMVLINNSYATGGYCSMSNELFNYMFDKVAIDFPNVLHVYAAGNTGQMICPDYPAGFNTVYSGGNSSKNTLSVGNTLQNGVIAVSSSKGPGYSGRVKPDIMAVGTDVISTVPINGYGYGSGTSMACPAVVGGLALLHQRYGQLHNQEVPEAALMKAIICNTARDLGNRGPDFSYGYGWLNLLRAVRALDNNWHHIDSVSQQAVKNFQVDIPAGTAQLKVMLYWHDPGTISLSSTALVNDLDLQVISNDGTTTLPYILDTNRANITLPATRGEDHLNNAEQVVIDNPAPGNYTFSVRGTDIGQGLNQRYALVYDIIKPELELTFPSGGEGLTPNEPILIQWEDWQNNTSDYALEFSADGNSWQVINAAVAASSRQYAWTLPATVTKDARVRIKRNDGTGNNLSGAFTVVGVPVMLVTPVQCPGYINFVWSTVSGATDYEVFLLQNGQMRPIAITTGTQYKCSALSPDTLYWVSVRARIDGKPGRRAYAVSRKPDNGSCSGDISDGDLQLAGIVSPLTGRRHTSIELGANEKVTLSIKNNDDQPITGFVVKYNFNNNGWVAENVPATIPAFGVYEHSFSTGIDLSALGKYSLRAVVTGTSDQNPDNDSISTQFSQLDNPVMDISVPFIDSFATAVPRQYRVSWRGLEGAEKYDYNNESGKALLTYTNNQTLGTSFQGMKLTMSGTLTNADHHELIGTYNLSGYDTGSHELGLRYSYIKFSLGSNNNKIYIRGNDSSPWIYALTTPALPASAIDLFSPFINLSKILRAAGQNFSSSFQISFDQRFSFEQHMVSEIDLADLTHDVGVLSIDSIKAVNTQLGNAIPVRFRYINHGRLPISNLHVKYKLDEGSIVDEIIPQVPSSDTLVYIFTQKADLSAIGSHQLEVWAESPGDLFPSNDRKKIIFRNLPLITQFPYLEGFEQGDGNWYGEGANSSWEYGTPSSTVINNAANGSKAWKTGINSSYHNSEVSYLYSPVFDLSKMKRPMVSISIKLNYDNCYNFACDVFNTYYSVNGTTWGTYTPASTGYDWGLSWDMSKGNQWRVSTNVLPVAPQVRLRFMLRTNDYLTLDGVAIDDIHIYDSIGSVYDGNSLTAPIEKTINGGNEWVSFFQGDKIIAAINPNNQDIGLTKAMVYTREGAARNFHGQSYLNRNFMLTSAKKAADSIGVRLYFRDREADSLITSKNCAGCTRPADAYRLGVSAYHSTDESEYNNDVIDDIKGGWSFFDHTRTRIVPFADGYYAEFKVKDLSEFWLHNGGLDNKSYLPVKWTGFQASSFADDKALLKWSTATEINIDHFDIELANSKEAYEQGIFTKIGEQPSQGLSAQEQFYEYTDALGNKKGISYYRLKAVDAFGNYSYSNTISVVWNYEVKWEIYPNPSITGLFNLKFQAEEGERIQLSIYNSVGALIRQQDIMGNGFIQNAAIDLGRHSAAGLYLLQVKTPRSKFSLKLVRQ